MNPDRRKENRIPLVGGGFLLVKGKNESVEFMDISNQGACLKLTRKQWSLVGNAEYLSGALLIEGREFPFKAAISWSSYEEGFYRTGIQFLKYDQELLDYLLKGLCHLEEPAGDNSFVL